MTVRLKRLLVFVPAYNCEKQIGRVLRQFSGDLADRVDTLLVIDNRSPDSTLEVAREQLAATPVKRRLLVRNCHNYGLGGSQKVGFAYALEHRFEWVMILHGDDQGSAVDMMPALREESARGENDAVLGARFMPGSRLSGYSSVRTFGNHLFNALFSLVLRRRVSDLGSGLNLYRTNLFSNGFHLKFPDDLTFNYCLMMAHAQLQHRFRFLPISWREDDQVSNVKLFSQARKVLAMLARFSANPGRFLATEHRIVPRSAYPFEVVYEAVS